MALANPGLTRLITGRIGDGWIRDLDELRRLEPRRGDDGVPRRVGAGSSVRTRSAWRG